MKKFESKLFLSLVSVVIFLLPALAQALSIDQSLSDLKSYKFGDDPESLNVIQETSVRSISDSALRTKLRQGLAEVLEAEASYDAKQFACRQLSLIATEKQAPALAKLLIDEQLSNMALYALERIPGEKVDSVLIDALKHTSGIQKAGIINTLGNRRSTGAVASLAGLLVGNDKDCAYEAAIALAKIAAPPVRQLMEKSFWESKNLDMDLWAQSCLIYADQLVSDEKVKQAGQMYLQIFTSSLPVHLRAAALRGLIQCEPQQQTELVVEAISDKNAKLSRVAASLVRKVPGTRATKAFVDALPKLMPAVQVQLIYALADRGDSEALPAVIDACKSTEQEVRVASLEALGKLGDTDCIDLLGRFAAKSSPAEKKAAQDSLRTMRGKNIDGYMILRLADADKDQAVIFIQALEQRNALQAAGALVKAARDEDKKVRVAALKALRTIGTEQEIPDLIDILICPDAKDLGNVRKTIVVLAKRCSFERQTVAGILARGGQAKSISRRKNILLVLGNLGDAGGLTALQEALKAPEVEIRYTAIQGLSDWPDASPIEDLLQTAKSSEVKTHRILALRGYISLLDKAENIPADQKLRLYQDAMQLAQSDQEKKRILGVLANVKTIKAMEYAQEFLGNAALKSEAAQATVAIAEKFDAEYPSLVRSAMEKILAQDISAVLQKQAEAVIDKMDVLETYVTDWQVSGPYLQKGKTFTVLFDIAFGPEISDSQVKWTPIPVSKFELHPAYIDLTAALGEGEQQIAYLRSTIESSEQKEVSLEIFSDDGVKVWLNGHVVHSANTGRGISPHPDKVNVSLNKGANNLLLKVTQNLGPWGAIVRVRPVKKVEPKLGKGFKLHTINAESRFEAAGAMDVNRDGKVDIFCGGFWYESPGWEKHFVREIKEQDEYHYDFANLPLDVDGDGWCDIVDATWHSRTLFWVCNPGDSGGKFEVIEIDKPGFMETAILVDINGDGQPDVLPNIMDAGSWYEFKRDDTAKHKVKWIRHKLERIAGHGIGAGDINGDGRCDIISSKGWLEQPAGVDDPWKWHGQFDLGMASIPMLVHDVDGDSDNDIIYGLAHDYGIYWMAQDRQPDGSCSWTRHEIDKSWSQAHFPLLVDLNNDGQKELVTGKRYRAHNGRDPGGGDPLCVYYYSFNRKDGKWTRHLIHEGGKIGFGINTAAFDFDTDGDMDIIAPGKSGLYLLENLLR